MPHKSEEMAMPVWMDGGSSMFQHIDRSEARQKLKDHLVLDYSNSLTVDKLNEILSIDEQLQLRKVGDYNLVYIEAKKAYYADYFYGCCCLLGAMAESILAMLMNELRIDPKNKTLQELINEASKKRKIKLLREAGILTASEEGAFLKIIQERNKFAHGVPKHQEARGAARIMLKKSFVILRSKNVAYKIKRKNSKKTDL